MPVEREFDQSRRNVPSWEENPQLSHLRKQKGILQGQLNSALSELAAYKKQLEIASGKFNTILAQRETEVSNLRSTLAQRETEVSNLRSTLAQHEADLATARAELETHLNRVSIFRGQLRIPDRFDNYFVQPTNEIHRLMAEAEVHSEQKRYLLTEAAVIACKTLRRLITEPDYIRLEGVLSGNPDEYMRDFKAVTDDPDQFWEFVVAEYDLFTASGLSKEFGTNMLLECSRVVMAIREGEVSPRNIGKSLRTFRHQSCNLAYRLENEIQEEKTRGHTKSVLRRVLLGGVGAVVMGGLNTYALGLPDFGPVFSNTSLALAGGLAGLFVEK